MNWLMKYWWSYRRGYTINPDWHQSTSKRLSSSTFCLLNPWTTIKKAWVAIIAALATIKFVKRIRWIEEWLLKSDVYTHLNLMSEIRGAEGEDYENYYRMKYAFHQFNPSINAINDQFPVNLIKITDGTDARLNV
jgi:hypothetical protein